MTKKLNNTLTNYLSLILVLTYFIFHSIILVLMGISLSLYVIYKDSLKSLLDKFKTKKSKEESIEPSDCIIEDNANKQMINDNSKDRLVDIVEELGFIPSIDMNDDINAA